MSELIIETASIPDDGTFEQIIESYTSDALVDSVKEQELSVSFVVQKLDAEILVRGQVYGHIIQDCSRCLHQATCEILVPFAQAYPSDQPIIDIEPEVRDALVLSLPDKPLCQEECKGLCPMCGANKNEMPCSCVQPVNDPRLSKLKELL